MVFGWYQKKSQERVKRMPGYIYLIMMADGVYKVGRTEQPCGMNLQRFKKYPADSMVAFVRKYNGNLPELEKMIITEFHQKFKKHIRGHEYFTGVEDYMINVINESFLRVRDNAARDIEVEVEKYLETFSCPEPTQLQTIIWKIESPFRNDDDVVNRDYLTRRLQEMGYTVTGDGVVYGPLKTLCK